MEWREKDLNKLTEWIEKHYFSDASFGTVSKSEIDTFMFSLYLDNLIDRDEVYDDFTVGKQLGLTNSRVRSLKERKQLKYPRNYHWADAFVSCIENAKYDSTTHMMKVNIPDVNVIKELRYFVEKNGWYDEYQLNPKLFQCPADVFIKLCSLLPTSEGFQENYVLTDEMKKSMRDIDISNDNDKHAVEVFLKDTAKDGLKEFLKSASKELLLSVLDALPYGHIAGMAIKYVSKVIRNS